MIAQLNNIAQIWWQWMGSMFWQVSLFIILITALDMAIRRWAWPQVRYVLWALVFIKLIIPPTWQMPTSIVSWIQPKVEQQISVRVESKVGIPQNSQRAEIAASEMAVEADKISWQAIVFLIWFSGMTTFSLMLIIKMSHLRRLHQSQTDPEIPDWFNELLIRTANQLSVKKIPSVIFSKNAKSPAVYGLFRPVLLLPEWCLDQLSQDQTEHVLMHELCHMKRGDLLVHWFCLILQVIYWFNPLLIWTRRQMRHVCEICCDLSVADILREKTISYRNTLLITARELLAETVEPGLGFLGVFEEPFRLVTRLKWLEKKTWGNKKRKASMVIVTAFLMIFCVMPMAGFSQTDSQSNNISYRTDVSSTITNVQGMLDENGVVKPMVYMEGLIFEVDEDKDHLGFTMPQPPSGNQKDEASDIPKPIIIGEKSFMNLKDAIEAMKTEQGFKILAEPKVMSQDNKKATIECGPSLNIPAKMERKGNLEHLTLEITSQIQENGLILQKITLEAAQPAEGDTNGIVTNRIDTNVMVKDGNTIVIGGIKDVDDSDAIKNSSGKRNLYIFLTPHIIKTKEDLDKFSQGLNFSTGDITDNQVTKILNAVTLDVREAEISQFIKLVHDITGKTFVYDDKIKGKVSITAKSPISIDEVYKIFESALDENGYKAVPSGDVIKIMEK